MTTVNPPPILRIPKKWFSDQDVRVYLESINRILFQLYTKTGAGGDLLSDTLQSISTLGTAANKGIYTTGINTWAEFDLTAAGRAILDDANATAQRATLGLVIGTDVQAWNANLQSISALGTAANKGLYTTGVDTWAEFDLTAAGRALLDDANAAAQRTTLGLGTIATQDANSVSITGGSISGITDLAVADGGTGASTASDARTNLGLVIGTHVQAYSANLDTYAANSLTATELGQLQNIDTTTVSVAQWGYLGALDQGLATTNSVTFNSLTLTTDLAITEGGTGASTASGARTNLGVAIGSDVQAYSTSLDEAGTFFASTDISAAEAETLTDGSNADGLHVHSTTGLSDVTNGTYTPTLTDTSNVSSSISYGAQYIRVGNIVTVSGRVQITPTSGSTATILNMSLPIASTISNAHELAGTGATLENNSAAVFGDTSANNAVLRTVVASASARDWWFTFTYQVI